MNSANGPGPARFFWLGACFVVLLSAYVQFTAVAGTHMRAPIRADARHYVSYAYNLENHGIFSRTPTWIQADDDTSRSSTPSPAPDKLTLPGYPAFLTLFLDGAPDWSFIDRTTLAQAALGVLTTFLSLLLAMQAMPRPWALATATLVAMNPHLASISTLLLTESLYASAVAASLLAVGWALACRGSTWRFALAGVTLALACLVRPQLQLLPLLLTGLVLLNRKWRGFLPNVLTGLLCFALVMSPWWIRNSGIERPPGEPDLLVSTLYHGSFPSMMYQQDPRSHGFAYRFDPEQAQATADLGSVLGRIRDNFIADPARYLHWYLLGKPEYFLSWNIIAGGGDVFIYPVVDSPLKPGGALAALRMISYLLHWPLTILALAGIVLAFWRPHVLGASQRQRSVAQVLAATMALVIVMHMIGAPYPRYGIPFRPLVFVLGLVTLRAGIEFVRTRRLRLESR